MSEFVANNTIALVVGLSVAIIGLGILFKPWRWSQSKSTKPVHRAPAQEGFKDKILLDLYQSHRDRMWVAMRMARLEVVADIQTNGRVTKTAAMTELAFCWNQGIYNKWALDLLPEVAGAIVSHCNLYEGDRNPWQEAIHALWLGKTAPSWETITDYRNPLPDRRQAQP